MYLSVTLRFNVANLWRNKKKKKEIAFLKAIKKHPLWGKLNIYKDQVQAFNSFHDHLSSAFEPQLPTFFLPKAYLESTWPSLISASFWFHTRINLGFTPKITNMRVEMKLTYNQLIERSFLTKDYFQLKTHKIFY